MNLPSKIFVDTSFFIALLNDRDIDHSQALVLQTEISKQKVQKFTSEYVLVELGDGLSRLQFRNLASRLIQAVQQDHFFTIVPASEYIFAKAMVLFTARPDKEWGVTDCASMVIMQELNLQSVLTADHHFRQAGFQTLLL